MLRLCNRTYKTPFVISQTLSPGLKHFDTDTMMSGNNDPVHQILKRPTFWPILWRLHQEICENVKSGYCFDLDRFYLYAFILWQQRKNRGKLYL
jgi:hypothetical protein